jgi:hypothetical protein
MGPTLYAIGDPEAVPDGGTMTPRTLLDTIGSRGLRSTLPLNYFDGGDRDASGNLRLNPTTPPTLPPSPLGSWLSPNADGLGWWVWGDSSYGNAAFIDTPTKKGFVLIPALCTGKCWYMNSTLNFDARTQEVQVWDPARLGAGPLTRPDVMSELVIPDHTIGSWQGDVPQRNISGVFFDDQTNLFYLIEFPDGGDIYSGRLFVYALGGSVNPPPPSPPSPPSPPPPPPSGNAGPQPAPAPPADTSSPVITVTAPASVTRGTPITITATASDDVGVTRGTAQVRSNSTKSISYPFSMTFTPTSAGTIAYAFTATDAAGNVGLTSGTIAVVAPSNKNNRKSIPMTSGSAGRKSRK